MNFKIEDYIDFHVLFITISITIAYKYITNESNIIVEKKYLRPEPGIEPETSTTQR